MIQSGIAALFKHAFHRFAPGVRYWPMCRCERLDDLVSAYQSVKELGMGELWTIPIMLRLALIENIRQISMSIVVN